MTQKTTGQESVVRRIIQNEYTWLVSVVVVALSIFGSLANLEKGIALVNNNVDNLKVLIEQKIAAVEERTNDLRKIVQKLEDEGQETSKDRGSLEARIKFLEQMKN